MPRSPSSRGGTRGWRRPDVDPGQLPPRRAHHQRSVPGVDRPHAGPLPVPRQRVRGRRTRSGRRPTTSTTRTPIWRSCFEGQLTWLNTVERGAEYRSGDAMGCTGVWFSGRWRTPTAVQYIARVDDYLRTRVWTQASFGPSTPGGPTTTAPATTAPTTRHRPRRRPRRRPPRQRRRRQRRRPPRHRRIRRPPRRQPSHRPRRRTDDDDAPTTTTPPTTTQAPTTTTAPPAGGDFFADFNTPGQSRACSGMVSGAVMTRRRRPDAVAGRPQHGLSAPDQKRTIHRSRTRRKSFFKCAHHIMVSEGDTSGYSIGMVDPEEDVQMSGQARSAGTST